MDQITYDGSVVYPFLFRPKPKQRVIIWANSIEQAMREYDASIWRDLLPNVRQVTPEEAEELVKESRKASCGGK